MLKRIIKEELIRVAKIFEAGPSRAFRKAAEALHAAELAQQQLRKKFVAEKDPKKKEAMKADLIKMHKSVRQIQSAFDAVLRNEPVDLEMEVSEATTSKSKPSYFKGLSKKDKEERERVIKRRSKMDDDDPDAYKKFRSDAGAKTKPSQHTKKYKQMFGEVSSNVKKALQKKSKATGIPYGILKQVFNRGMAAWKTGHKPGATQQQWGYARVNSFATKGKGTWGGADKDLAKKARDKK